MHHFSIDIQPTKNENIVKFIANIFLTQADSFEFKNIDEAKPSPLAQQLFYLPFVKTVYISQNFVAIEKFNIVEWADVQEEVAEAIMEYLKSGDPVIKNDEILQKTAVTVYAESTPNPSVMKFVANKPLAAGIFEFKNIDEASNAPLAAALFNFPFVKEVFISDNYVSVAKYDVAEWQEVSMEIRQFIREYIAAGKTILEDKVLNAAKTDRQKETVIEKPLTDIDQQIIQILDEYVKPAVAGDGGHIAFESFNPDSKTVRVILQGACSGCPSSTVTLKNGIENMLRELLKGQVEYVEAING
jgi:Fe-S cluster biogenesis protein NfuA